ncbi:NAD-dependent epimerase/dehydratase family protein [Tenacibaculum maritimum]|nr:NAD-dependent epimerase/dehydratase family protein [Tenacibaculum maritimum]
MKKIIITGSNGLLGQTLVNLLLEDKEQYDVIGFSRGGNRSGRVDFKYESIDLTDSSYLQKKY